MAFWVSFNLCNHALKFMFYKFIYIFIYIVIYIYKFYKFIYIYKFTYYKMYKWIIEKNLRGLLMAPKQVRDFSYSYCHGILPCWEKIVLPVSFFGTQMKYKFCANNKASRTDNGRRLKGRNHSLGW